MTIQNDKPEAAIQDAIKDIVAQLAEEARRERVVPIVPNRSRLSASAHAASCIPDGGVQSLNENELKSVYALLAYVAHNENVQQETVQSMVEANFGVNHVTKLQHRDYEDVIRFLVDLRLDEMKD